jgi:hypothetical protein
MKTSTSIALVCFLTTLIGSPLRAEVANLDQARSVCDAIMRSVGVANYKAAFETAAEHWPMQKEEIDGLRVKTSDLLAMGARRYGTLVGTEFVEVKTAGSSVARYIYLQKFRHHAIRWTVVFYRAEANWQINTIVWDDKLSALFN